MWLLRKNICIYIHVGSTTYRGGDDSIGNAFVFLDDIDCGFFFFFIAAAAAIAVDVVDVADVADVAAAAVCFFLLRLLRRGAAIINYGLLLFLFNWVAGVSSYIYLILNIVVCL